MIFQGAVCKFNILSATVAALQFFFPNDQAVSFFARQIICQWLGVKQNLVKTIINQLSRNHVQTNGSFAYLNCQNIFASQFGSFFSLQGSHEGAFTTGIRIVHPKFGARLAFRRKERFFTNFAHLKIDAN